MRSSNRRFRLTLLAPSLFLLDFGPRIAERYGAVEDQSIGRRLGIDAKIAKPLELETLPR
jgi:hypothetical protein